MNKGGISSVFLVYGSESRFLDDRGASVLSPAEQARANRYRLATHRGQFIQRRAFLREVLANHLGCDPGQVELETGQYGKPRLRGDSKPHFSISSTATHCVVALSWHGEVGIDLETMQPLPELQRIAADLLQPAEQAWLKQQQPGMKLESFLKLWTFKEALGKATGLGLDPRVTSICAPFVDGGKATTDWWVDYPKAPVGAICCVLTGGGSSS